MVIPSAYCAEYPSAAQSCCTVSPVATVALLLLALLPVALSLQAQDTFWVNGIRYSIDYVDEYYWGTPDVITLKVISATGSTTYSG